MAELRLCRGALRQAGLADAALAHERK